MHLFDALVFLLRKKEKNFSPFVSSFSTLSLRQRVERSSDVFLSKCCNFAEAEECEACVESGEMQSVKVCESRDQVYLFVSEYVLEWQR